MRKSALMLVALAACAPTRPLDQGPVSSYEPPVPPPPAPPASCTVTEEMRREVRGRAYTPELGSDLRRRANAVTMRTLRPGQVVTMEYRHDRLNIDLDDAGKITGARCG